MTAFSSLAKFSLSTLACACMASGVWAGPAEMAAIQSGKKALATVPDLAYAPDSVLVKFKSGVSQGDAGKALAAVQAAEARRFDLVPGLVQAHVRMPVDQAVAALARNPNVEYAEPDYVQRTRLTPNDTYYGLLWGMHNTGQSIQNVTGLADADIDMPEAWDISTGGSGCLVAVIDTGVQWSHPDLDANIWTNPGEVAGNGIDDDGNGYVDDVRGWDFFAGDNNPDDEGGHGTHVAGTIAAEGNNGIGVAGVAWNCKVMPLRFLGPDGGYTSDAVSALNYAVAKGVKVSNNSWGGGGYSSALYNAISNAKAKGHVFVAAAGNEGVNTDSGPHYPSAYDLDNIISVAATDNADKLATFSNHGAATVDLGAPGVSIASTYINGGYVWMNGTSMASPHVAGVAALVYLKNPSYTYSQVVDQILGSVRPVSALYGLTKTGGVLNAQAALAGDPQAPVNTPPSVSISSPADGTLFQTGTSITFQGSANDAEDGSLTASIAWNSSVEGNLGSGASVTKALVSGSHVITANVLDSEGVSASKTITVHVGSSPAAPSTVSVTNNRNGTATLKWTDNATNEESYRIARQVKNKNGTWSSATYLTVAKDATSYIDKSGTGTFRYQIQARNKFGDSAWSAFVEVTVTRK